MSINGYYRWRGLTVDLNLRGWMWRMPWWWWMPHLTRFRDAQHRPTGWWLFRVGPLFIKNDAL
jgi:hypothetical protein